MVTKAPQEEQRLKKGLAEAVSLVDNVEAKSFNVTAQRALLHEAATLLEKMRGMIAERRYGEIPATAKAIQTKYQEAEEGALELVDRQEKMEKAKAGIQEDVSMAEAKIKEAEEVLKKDDPLVSEEARRALSEAGQKLASAKKELKQAEPDYLKASEDCHEAQASAERAMVMGRKRQADAILADLREQMRENPRNVSPEARRQMEEIEASYRRADSGGLSNTDLLLLYMMINQQSHSTMVINQQNIESGTHFADHGYGSRGGYSPSGESSERGSSRDDDGPSGGSTGWGGSEDSGGGGSSDSGGGDSGGGDSGGGDSGGGGDSSY